MDTLVQTQVAELRPAWWEDRRTLLALWILSGLLLVGFIWHIPLERTQEARVLQVAREMLEDGYKWIIPHINGKVRLQKPPLAYWLAATSFEIFGVHTWAGRLPMALLSWLTVGMTFITLRAIFNARAALFAAASLTGCYLFYKYGQAAETDIIMTFFLTVAIYTIWRGFWTERWWSGFWWYHASALAMALGTLGKGPPACLAGLFFLGLMIAERRWKVLWDYLKSGAPLTLFIVAAPWFLYVVSDKGSDVLLEEGRVLLVGVDHPAPIYHYIPLLFKMTLPWAGLFGLAVLAAIPHWKRDRSVRTVLLWTASIFVPFTVIGQKQEHYLLPLMPAVMGLIGWMLDRALTDNDPPLTKAVTWAILGTAVAGLSAAALPIVGGQFERGWISALDIAIGAVNLSLMVAVLVLYRRKGLAAATYSIVTGGTLIMALLLSVWMPRVEIATSESIGSEIRHRYGNVPYAFYHSSSITLSFGLRHTMRTFESESELAQALQHEPNLVIVHEKKEGDPIPLGLVQEMRWVKDEDVIAVYRQAHPGNQ